MADRHTAQRISRMTLSFFSFSVNALIRIPFRFRLFKTAKNFSDPLYFSFSSDFRDNISMESSTVLSEKVL